MTHILLIILVTSFLTTLTSAIATTPTKPSNLHKLHQYPNGTWVENIAIRSTNGNLLVTFANQPELWEVILPSPHHPGTTSQTRLLHRFPDAEMATGIAELDSDIFAVVTPNTVWKVDLNLNLNLDLDHDSDITPTRIATVHQAGNLNGMALLDKQTGLVAISDSQLGLVWGLDTNTGEYTVILKDETMASNTKLGPLLGINGVRVHNGYIYYVNSPERLFCRIPVDTKTGQAIGPREVIGQGALADDLAVSRRGTGYLAGLTDSVVTRVFADGEQEVVANSSKLMSATSAAFGWLGDSCVLFVTTGGDTPHVVNHTEKRGGSVMALSLGS